MNNTDSKTLQLITILKSNREMIHRESELILWNCNEILSRTHTLIYYTSTEHEGDIRYTLTVEENGLGSWTGSHMIDDIYFNLETDSIESVISNFLEEEN